MRSWLVRALGLSIGLLSVRPALACEIDRVIGENDASPQWRGAVERLAHDLETSPECATLTVTLGNGSALINLTSADGRVAERVVTTPSALSSVTFGLLASIPMEAQLPPPPPMPVPLPFDEPLSGRMEPAPSSAPSVLPARDKVQPSIGFALGSRFAVPFGVVTTEAEIRTDVRVHGWIIAAATWASPLGTRLSEDTIQYREWGFGGEAGRWFPVGRGGLAWTAGPGFSSTSYTLHALHRERSDFAVQTVARYVAPFGSTWHPTVAAALDSLPAIALASESKHEEFPSWSASLRFGISGAGL